MPLQQLETFVCNIKNDFYKLVGDGILYVGWIASTYEDWAIAHGITLLFTIRFALMLYDIKQRMKDVKKEAWQTQVKPILKADAVRERKKLTFKKILDIFKLMFFR
jgi:hypothetical protein